MKQLLNKKISKVLRKSSTLFGSNTFFYLKKPVTKFKMAISTIMRALVIQLLSVVYLVALSVRLGEILEHVPTYKDYWTIIAGVLLNLLHLIAQWYLLRFYVHRYHYFIICKKLLHNIRFQPDSDSNVSLQIPLHHPSACLHSNVLLHMVCRAPYYNIPGRTSAVGHTSVQIRTFGVGKQHTQ